MNTDRSTNALAQPQTRPQAGLQTRTQTRLQALGGAAFLTLAMLLGVDSLTVVDLTPAQMAQAKKATA